MVTITDEHNQNEQSKSETCCKLEGHQTVLLVSSILLFLLSLAQIIFYFPTLSLLLSYFYVFIPFALVHSFISILGIVSSLTKKVGVIYCVSLTIKLIFKYIVCVVVLMLIHLIIYAFYIVFMGYFFINPPGNCMGCAEAYAFFIVCSFTVGGVIISII
jgi:hypothetical protein